MNAEVAKVNLVWPAAYRAKRRYARLLGMKAKS